MLLASGPLFGIVCGMKLRQGQIWKRGDEYLRIVTLDRLAVGYKSLLDPKTKDGSHHQATKKDFCKLLKGATLIPAAEVKAVQ